MILGSYKNKETCSFAKNDLLNNTDDKLFEEKKQRMQKRFRFYFNNLREISHFEGGYLMNFQREFTSYARNLKILLRDPEAKLYLDQSFLQFDIIYLCGLLNRYKDYPLFFEGVFHLLYAILNFYGHPYPFFILIENNIPNVLQSIVLEKIQVKDYRPLIDAILDFLSSSIDGSKESANFIISIFTIDDAYNTFFSDSDDIAYYSKNLSKLLFGFSKYPIESKYICKIIYLIKQILGKGLKESYSYAYQSLSNIINTNSSPQLQSMIEHDKELPNFLIKHKTEDVQEVRWAIIIFMRSLCFKEYSLKLYPIKIPFDFLFDPSPNVRISAASFWSYAFSCNFQHVSDVINFDAAIELINKLVDIILNDPFNVATAASKSLLHIIYYIPDSYLFPFLKNGFFDVLRRIIDNDDFIDQNALEHLSFALLKMLETAQNENWTQFFIQSFEENECYEKIVYLSDKHDIFRNFLKHYDEAKEANHQ